MKHLLDNIHCPNHHKAMLVCLNPYCCHPPLHCTTSTCIYASSHSNCQLMQIKAVGEYLQNWRSYVSEQGRQFMGRVDKIFSNIRSRLQKELKIFSTYCCDMFMGKDYSKLMYLIQKNESQQISSQLIASSLKSITDKGNHLKFSAFSLSEMQLIDQSVTQLASQIQSMYKAKKVQSMGVEKMKRCNSAVLQRQAKKSNPNNNNAYNNRSNCYGKDSSINSRNSTLLSRREDSICSLKLDLTFPKNINSRIVGQATAINKLISKKVHKYQLAYRASEHQFSIAQFYNKIAVITRHIKQQHVKHKQPYQTASLILAKTEYGKVLGGYTPVEWIQPKRSNNTDSDGQDNPQHAETQTQKHRGDCSASTIMFSLDLMEKYCLNKPDEAIYCGSKSIGFGRGDLKIVDRADQLRKSHCKFPHSYNFSSRPYVGWAKSGMELSGARYSVYFKVVEWQAFIIQY